MVCHCEFFHFPDLDDREWCLPFGKRGCEHFFEVSQRFERFIAGYPARFGVDQIDGPSGAFPLDRTPVNARKFRGDREWIVETEGFPERIGEGF
jgi:hypothetical protein